MNYFERLKEYSIKNYFVFNEKNGTVDVFGPLVPEWYQKLVVVLDMLTEASNQEMQDKYDILSIRVVGIDTDSEVIRILKDNLSLANKLLAESKGESKLWLDMKDKASLEKRHFLDINIETINTPKKSFLNKQNGTKSKSRTVQNISADK